MATRPLRVLYSFPHPLGSPGVGSTAWHQVNGLARAGATVDVWAAGVAVAPPAGVVVHRTLSHPSGLRLPPRTIGVDRAWAFHDAVVAAVLRSRAQDDPPDVVHAWPLASRHTLAAAQRAGIPGLREVPNAHTATAYAAAAQSYASVGLTAPRRSSHRADPARLRRELREYDLATRLLVPSDHVAESFLARGVPEHRLARHVYGYDSQRFHPAGRAPSGVGLRVAFVGRGEPRKGLHVALAAWVGSAAARRGQFVVCGAMEPAYARVLAPLLAHPSVTVQPFTDDVRAVLVRADALVLPSFEEGSALVTYEAQACAAALLISDRTGARCRHGVEGLVHPAGDVESLRRHMDELDGRADLRARLAGAALRNATGLTWEQAGQVLLRRYEEAVAAVAAPAGD